MYSRIEGGYKYGYLVDLKMYRGEDEWVSRQMFMSKRPITRTELRRLIREWSHGNAEDYEITSNVPGSPSGARVKSFHLVSASRLSIGPAPALRTETE